MNIGILTFHWATNYGAVLQCYALQTFLISAGHTVEIINYKPRQYDESLYKFLRNRKFLHLIEYMHYIKKERSIEQFRNEYLHLTPRIYTCDEISNIALKYDAIIAGSDQVCNPSFLMNGEGHDIITPTYFLGFNYSGLKIGYALSFGCVEYPKDALEYAKKYINNFKYISVRESTGVSIVHSMGRDDSILVPDPTILMTQSFYCDIVNKSGCKLSTSFIFCFFIRYVKDRKSAVKSKHLKEGVLWNNEDGDYTIQGWLYKIRYASYVITDSFHCVVMCLKLHKSFIVVTEQKGYVGMNDRMYTLLSKLNIESVIVYKNDFISLDNIDNKLLVFDWEQIDKKLEELSAIGQEYLTNKIL